LERQGVIPKNGKPDKAPGAPEISRHTPMMQQYFEVYAYQGVTVIFLYYESEMCGRWGEKV
jgi:hypothetical protein